MLRIIKLSIYQLLLCLMPLAAASPSLCADTSHAAEVGHKRVLILYVYNNNVPTQQQIVAGINRVVKNHNLRSADFVHEYLDIAPPKYLAHRTKLGELLVQKYAGQQFDLIVTYSTESLDFLLKEGKDLSPGSPCIALFAVLNKDIGQSERKITYRPLGLDIRGTLEQGLELFPNTRKVLFVSGVAENDKPLESIARTDFASWQGKLEFEYTSQRSVEDLMKYVVQLPPDTLIIYGNVSSDISGKAFVPRDVVKTLASISNAPVLSMFSTQIDTGVIGGSMIDMELLGVMIGNSMVALESGKPLTIEPASSYFRPMFNWTQIKRWGVNPDRLPADTLFVNRPLTIWGNHKAAVISAVLVIIILITMTVALSIQNRRRKIAEISVRKSAAQLVAERDMLEQRVIERTVDINNQRELMTQKNEELESALGQINRDKEALQEIRSHLNLLGDNLEEAALYVYSHDNEGQPHFEYLSAGIEKLTGVNTEDALQDASRLHSLILPEYIPSLIELEVKSREDLVSFEIETRQRNAITDNIHWALLRSTPRRRPDGSTVWYGVQIDITDRKRSENLLNQANEQLQEAKLAADAANQAKSEFLDNMNHEMRNPLNAVVGMTTMLLDTELSDIQRRYVETINYSSDNLLLLINNLLDISKIEEGYFELESYSFNLSSAVSKIMEIFIHSAAQKGLKLEVTIDSDLPLKLKGDVGRISQVLINLLGNAVKFTDKGAVSLYISKDVDNGQKVALRFKVIDSGIGIPFEKQEMIFSPFTQVDGSTTRIFGGTGLGLSICKKLVDLMGGEIGVESSEGKGAMFWFTVVLEKETDVNGAERPATTELRISSESSRSAIRLLLAEDDSVNQQVAISYLEKLGYSFDIVDNGRAALQALSERDYDLWIFEKLSGN